MMGSVVSLEKLISETERKRDDAEWEGEVEVFSCMERFLKQLYPLREKGDVWYPLF